MLISCIFENKIKGRTSIFYRKTGKDKPLGTLIKIMLVNIIYFVIYINAESYVKTRMLV